MARLYRLPTLIALVLIGGCFGPNPNQPDVLVVKNDLPEAATFEIIITDAEGTEVLNQTFDVAPRTWTNHNWTAGKGTFTIHAQGPTGNLTDKFTLAIVPQFVQVTARPEGLTLSLLHGD